MEIETRQGMTRQETVERFKAMSRKLRHDDLTGPALFWGSSGAHGLLYLDRFGRRQVDALSTFVNTLPGDPENFAVAVPRGTRLIPLDAAETLLCDAEGIRFEVVGPVVAKAVELIQEQPRSIPAAAAAAVEASLAPYPFDALIDAVATLIYLPR